MDEPKRKWYQSNGAIVLLLVFFFPVGLFLMWKYALWPKAAKWILSGFFGLIILANAVGGSTAKNSNSPTVPTTHPEAQATTFSTQAPQITQEATKTVTMTTSPTKPQQTQNKNNPSPSTQTTSQKNAVRKAQSYLNFTGFSRDGLVAQLEYEQFSHVDAVYGADNAGANWNEQAAKKAKSYMDFSAFSRGGLIDQLKYDKFTQEQAEYGANSVGL